MGKYLVLSSRNKLKFVVFHALRQRTLCISLFVKFVREFYCPQVITGSVFDICSGYTYVCVMSHVLVSCVGLIVHMYVVSRACTVPGCTTVVNTVIIHASLRWQLHLIWLSCTKVWQGCAAEYFTICKKHQVFRNFRTV